MKIYSHNTHSVLRHHQKSKKSCFFWLWGSNSDRFLFRVLSDEVLSGFNNKSVPFKVLNDRLLFNFLSDGSSLESSMIGSSLGCSDIGSSSGSSEIGFCHVFSVLFYWFAAFLKNKKANWATTFLIKSRCFVWDIFKKTFTQLTMSLTFFDNLTKPITKNIKKDLDNGRLNITLKI